jgi:raffinose/stachyose/melibiose transport system permease protein
MRGIREDSLFKKTFSSILLVIIAAIFAAPILLALINSFKEELSIIDSFIYPPNLESFAGIENYFAALIRSDLLTAFFWSALISFIPPWFSLRFSAMASWAAVRTRNIFSRILYVFFGLCLSVPFITLAWTIPEIFKFFHLNNPIGAIIFYIASLIPLNFFVYCFFFKRLSVKIEEAAFMEGYSPMSIFFKVSFPSLKKATAVLWLMNALWIWNDFLAPNLILGIHYKTLPMLIKSLSFGIAKNVGILSAVLVFTLIAAYSFYKRYDRRILKIITSLK